MSIKLLQTEGKVWVEKGIITQSQYESLLSLYPEKESRIGVVPILASIFIGLSILSFVAFNWQAMPDLLRLLVIVLTMSGFYLAGYSQYAKGVKKMGIALVGIGYFSFGAGIFLIGQMFNLMASNVFSFVVWGVVGILLQYLFRSTYLFAMTTIVLSIAQGYSIGQFDNYSYATLGLFLLGLGGYWYREKSRALTYMWSVGLLFQTGAFVLQTHLPEFWLMLLPLLLYAKGDIVKNRYLQHVPLLLGIVFSLIFTFFSQQIAHSLLNDPHFEYFAITSVLLLIVSLYLKIKQNGAWMEWILFIPFIISGEQFLMYLIPLFVFALWLLISSFQQESNAKINFAIGLFLVATFAAYTKLAWGFNSKSLFFLIGGILLFGLHRFLLKRKKETLGGEGE